MQYFLHLTKAFMTKPKVSFGVFIFFLIVAIVITAYAVSWGTQDRQSAHRASSQIGKEIIAGDIALTVHGVRRDSVGGGPLIPQKGNEFLITMLTVRNLGSKPFELIPLLQFHIKDSAGNIYNVTAVPTPGNQLSGPLSPHDLVREELGFEVPRGINDPMLYFESEQKVFVVDLKKAKFWR